MLIATMAVVSLLMLLALHLVPVRCRQIDNTRYSWKQRRNFISFSSERLVSNVVNIQLEKPNVSYRMSNENIASLFVYLVADFERHRKHTKRQQAQEKNPLRPAWKNTFETKILNSSLPNKNIKFSNKNEISVCCLNGKNSKLTHEEMERAAENGRNEVSFVWMVQKHRKEFREDDKETLR